VQHGGVYAGADDFWSVCDSLADAVGFIDGSADFDACPSCASELRDEQLDGVWRVLRRHLRRHFGCDVCHALGADCGGEWGTAVSRPFNQRVAAGVHGIVRDDYVCAFHVHFSDARVPC